MVTAYLLMNTKPGTETKVAEELVDKKEIKDISIVYGVFDVIVKIVVKNMADLQQFVLNLRKDTNIESSSTLISTNSA